jgi:hypothetical protein
MADHSVAADLSGDTTLTSDLTGSVPIASSLSGDTSLTGELDQDFVVTSDLSGDTTLTSNLTGSGSIASDLSGDAAITATDATTVPIAVDLSGDATFAATGVTTVPITAGLSGDASQTSGLMGVLPVASSLSGDVAFVATDVTTVPVTATLSGDAALAGKLDQDFVVVSDLVGDAALGADLDQGFVVVADLSGDAALTVELDQDFVVASSLSGDAALVGELDQDFIVAADLSGDVVLTATDATTVPIASDLSGDAAMAASALAALPVASSLSGDAALTADVAGAVLVEAGLSGDTGLDAFVLVPRYSIESLTFDGVNEYVTMGNVLGFEYTDAFSYSFWVKTSGSDGGYLLSKMEDSPNYRGYGVYRLSGGTLRLHFINIDASSRLTVDTTRTINDGKWHHVVVTYDGSATPAGVYCYIDNSSDTLSTVQDNLAGTMITAAPFNLNGRGDGILLTAAQLDEVSVWNKDLTSGEVSEVWSGGHPANLDLHSANANLVGWWRMGENISFPTIPDMVQSAGENPYPLIADYSGNGYDGTFVGGSSAAIQTAAPYGTAITFDGVDDYITVPNHASYSFEYTDAFSISAWARIASGVAVNRFIVIKSANGTGPGYWLSTYSTGTMWFELANVNGSVEIRATGPNIADNTWHHLVATYDGSGLNTGLHVYMDGVDVTNGRSGGPLAATIVTTSNLGFGGSGSGGLAGGAKDISNPALWNKELSAGEVSELYNGGRLPVDMTQTTMAANLVGWWPLGVGDIYPTVRDLSTGGHNGTMTGMAANDIVDFPLAASAFSQKSVYFNNYYVDMGNVLNYERTDSFSFTAWFKNSATGVQMILGKVGPESYRGYSVYTQSGQIRVEIISSWSGNWIQRYTSGLSVSDSRWHHVAVTYDGSSQATGVTIYVDGRLPTLTTGANSLSGTIVTSATLRIGTRQTGALPFYGNIDEVAFYGKTLSQAEVSEMYNLGVPTNLSGLASATDLDAWWRMGEVVTKHPGTMVNMEVGDVTYDTLWSELVEAGLSGDAALTVTSTASVPIDAALSGDAALVGDLGQDLVVASTLTGDADLGSTLVGTVPLDTILSGEAALTADINTTATIAVAATLSGEATLGVDLTGDVPVASALAGDADLQATLQYTVLGLLETVGLSEAIVVGQTHQVVAAFTGDAAFGSAVLVEASLEAALEGVATFTANPVQDIEAVLSGDADLIGDFLSGLLVEATLAGTATVVADATADVLVASDVSGEASLFGEVGVHGDLVRAMQGEAALKAKLSISRSGVRSDASIIPKPSPQESAYQTEHYSIQDRRR